MGLLREEGGYSTTIMKEIFGKTMSRSQHVVLQLFLVLLLAGFISFAQSNRSQSPGSNPTENRPVGTLKLVTIGNGATSGGRDSAFRVYAAPDGTKGRIVYTELPTIQEAQKQVQEWLNLTTEVVSQEHDKKQGDEIVSDRIVARRRVKSTNGEFMIIRRDGLICYLIESRSLHVATQIESTISLK